VNELSERTGARVLRPAELPQARRVLDVGSGGGLPGVVIAIWAQQAAPAMQVPLSLKSQAQTSSAEDMPSCADLATATPTLSSMGP
jgi:predicted nicotinamide N-methyase